MKHSSLKFYTQCINDCSIMLRKCHRIVLYILCILQHFVSGGRFSGHSVYSQII